MSPPFVAACAIAEKPLSLTEQPQIGDTDIIPHLYFFRGGSYLEDSEQDTDLGAIHWQMYRGEHIDFGFTHDLLWLCLPLSNPTNQPVKRVLNLNSRFMNFIEVDFISDGATEVLLSESSKTRFSNRPIPNRYLATEFELAPNSQAEIFVRYFSLGSTTLPLAIHTEKDYYQNWVKKNVGTVAFYSVILFLIAFSFFQFLVLKSPIQLAYIGYVGSASLYIFHMDGLSFKFLWPMWPELNAEAAVYIGLAINFFSIFFARGFLNTKKTNPKIDLLFKIMLVLVAGLMIGSAISDAGIIKKLSFLLTTSVLFTCAIAGFVAYFQGQKSARYYTIGWVGITFCAALASASNLISAMISIPFTFDLSKVGVFFDSLMFAMAMADQTNEIRKERDAATQKQTELLKKELETQQRLASLESEYRDVLSLAQEKSHLLANAGHDLRQPLVALRAAMQVVVDRGEDDPQSLDQFKQGFNYIEQLITKYLSVPVQLQNRGEAHSHSANVRASDDAEVFSINVILSNLKVMFESEAREKELHLSIPKCTTNVKADPIVVMRILSNLLENAIKYTQTGKILVACRRRSESLEVFVMDTGPGIPHEHQSAIFNAYERADASESVVEGLGLGLNIVTLLAKESRFPFTLRKSNSSGTTFSLTVPRQI